MYAHNPGEIPAGAIGLYQIRWIVFEREKNARPTLRDSDVTTARCFFFADASHRQSCAHTVFHAPDQSARGCVCVCAFVRVDFRALIKIESMNILLNW